MFFSLFLSLLPLPPSLLDDTPETIGNNASYLRAVENGRDRETPLRRTTLHDTSSSNNKSSSSRLVKTMRTSSMKVTPLQPATTTTGEESNRYENLIIHVQLYVFVHVHYVILSLCVLAAVLNDG